MSEEPTSESEVLHFFHLLGAWKAAPTVLHADRSSVSDQHVEHLPLLPQLEHLVLSETSITDSSMPVICGLHNLALLDISGTRITDKGAMHLASLSNLRCLGLARTSIGDTTTEIIAALDRIDMLNFNCTEITDTGLTNLATLTRLRSIEIRHTNTTSDGVAAFRKSLPGCLLVTDSGVVS